MNDKPKRCSWCREDIPPEVSHYKESGKERYWHKSCVGRYTADLEEVAGQQVKEE